MPTCSSGDHCADEAPRQAPNTRTTAAARAPRVPTAVRPPDAERSAERQAQSCKLPLDTPLQTTVPAPRVGVAHTEVRVSPSIELHPDAPTCPHRWPQPLPPTEIAHPRVSRGTSRSALLASRFKLAGHGAATSTVPRETGCVVTPSRQRTRRACIRNSYPYERHQIRPLLAPTFHRHRTHNCSCPGTGVDLTWCSRLDPSPRSAASQGRDRARVSSRTAKTRAPRTQASPSRTPTPGPPAPRPASIRTRGAN